MPSQGWTKAYSRISDIGVGAYLAYFALYMVLVEFGIYWMHRLLHDIRPGYRCSKTNKLIGRLSHPT